jgi:hypothetical protein
LPNRFSYPSETRGGFVATSLTMQGFNECNDLVCVARGA